MTNHSVKVGLKTTNLQTNNAYMKIWGKYEFFYNILYA